MTTFEKVYKEFTLKVNRHDILSKLRINILNKIFYLLIYKFEFHV